MTSTVPPAPAARQPVAASESRRWLFANAVLDERTFELSVSGEEVEIERKPFEVLRFLLQHAGEVVTKDELLAGVWPGRFLSDTVLTKCIGRLRKALGDDEETTIKTVYGYGYRFVAPVRIEVQHAPEAARFDFKEGDHPAGRPLWSLIRRLGAGGHGEAWLGRHDKTHEQRVFKFAIDEPSLAALKREITLFRFLNDSLGERARIVPLLDWNLEQPPCFIEMEYVAGGSLIEWAERSGGLAKIPLATRIEIAAQIAEALAAVHSVGVLHKDLKPSNVLIEGSLPPGGGRTGWGVSGTPDAIRLADFGSGGVLDPKKLEALGITRLGFTKTVAALGATGGGTLLYLAPELLAGQPPTVKADIYALGVMLYQLVVGEFRKAMSPGWEHEIADEVLRECIAEAAQGEAALRSADAAEIARRLRGLEEEREKRRRGREAREEAEAANRALERLNARRTGLRIAFGVLIVGLVASIVLYLDARRARAKAEQAAALAQGVSDFLGRDMFSVLTSGKTPLKNLTVQHVLDSAAAEVDKRFADQPDTAVAVHAALGRSYLALEIDDRAEDQLSIALASSQERNGDADAQTLKLASELIPLTYAMGTIKEQLGRFDKILQAGAARLGASDPRILQLRMDVARGRLLLGQWLRGAKELQVVVDESRSSSTAVDPYFLAQAELALGHVLDELAEFADAERHLRHGLQLVAAARGERSLDVARARLWLGHVLSRQGRFDEARSELSAVSAIAREWLGENSGYLYNVRLYEAEIELERGDETAIGMLDALLSDYRRANHNVTIDESWYYQEPLALAYQRAGRLAEAEQTMRAALASAEAAVGPAHPGARRIRIALADILLSRGSPLLARSALEPSRTKMDLTDLPADHPIRADFLRVNGLLLRSEGDATEGRAALNEALHIYAVRYGNANWRTQRLRTELGNIR